MQEQVEERPGFKAFLAPSLRPICPFKCRIHPQRFLFSSKRGRAWFGYLTGRAPPLRMSSLLTFQRGVFVRREFAVPPLAAMLSSRLSRPNPPNLDGQTEKRFPCRPVSNSIRSADGEAADGGALAHPVRIRPNPPNADGRAEKRFPCCAVRGWPLGALARAFGEFAPCADSGLRGADRADAGGGEPEPANRAKNAPLRA